MDVNTITDRLEGLGWKMRTIPIRKSQPDGSQIIARWRIIAFKGEKSYETTGETQEATLNSLGKALGVIPNDPH